MMLIPPRATAEPAAPPRLPKRGAASPGWSAARGSARWAAAGTLLGAALAVTAQTSFPLPPPVPERTRAIGQPAFETPETARLRAETLARRGQIGEALAIIRRLLQADPGNVQFRLAEAQYIGWLGRAASAGERYRRLIQENPADATAQEGYGNTHLWRGNWREAQAGYGNAIAATGANHVTAHVGFLRALLAAGRATPAYRQAVDLDQRTGRQDAEVGLFLASFHAAVDLDEAAFALSSRRTSDPELRLRQTTFQAQRLVARGQKDDGLNLITSYAEAHPHEFSALIAAGEVCITARQFREARDFFNRAAQVAPDREEAVIGLAHAAHQQSKLRESLALYEEVVTHNPESLAGWRGIAEVAWLRGDVTRAWQALDSAQRIAPGSALVYRDRLKIAFQEKDADAFFVVLRDYQRVQPADAWPELWAQKWAASHGGEVNVVALEALLDPLEPELSGEALSLLRKQTGEPLPRAVARVPAAPSADLHDAAQEKLRKQVRLANPTVIGISTGYEFSSLQDTSGAGARLQEWHEGYLAAYWRQPLGMTVSGEYRTFSRFGASANQILLGWNTHVTPSWIMGVDVGGALNGGFIPRWRAGVQTEYFFTDKVSANLSVTHLRFADEPVFQLVPGVTWQWHPHWASHAQLYATHTEPKGGPVNTGFAGLINTTWQFSPLSSTTLTYAIGEENPSQLIKGLIGEKNFQSIGIALKYGFTEHISLQPTYRYETHNLFDLHAFGLSLNLRY